MQVQARVLAGVGRNIFLHTITFAEGEPKAGEFGQRPARCTPLCSEVMVLFASSVHQYIIQAGLDQLD